MIYAVIDTNVLVAAAKSHKPDSSASRVLSLVFSGIIQPLVCDEILEEYEGILRLPVLAVPEDISAAILSKFREDGINPGRAELLMRWTFSAIKSIQVHLKGSSNTSSLKIPIFVL